MPYRRKRSKDYKLQVIKSVLNGNFDLVSLAAPRFFNVIVDAESYTVSSMGDSATKRILDKVQYEKWHSTLRQSDLIFIIHLEDYSEGGIAPTANDLLADQQLTRYNAAQKEKPVESPVLGLESIIAEEPKEEVVLVAVPVRKTSGKMSEYGITWGMKHSDIYYS